MMDDLKQLPSEKENLLMSHNMTRLDKIIKDVEAAAKKTNDMYYIADSLHALQNIIKSGSCNDCKAKLKCKYTPKLGQLIRYNCPFYERDDE